ncbi:hypothetical protein IMZ48_16675 [Candidatus Bathyarchaeota archaeon]|nr:hypothetical protein [Candidatus Bathyarchaeota archaeon]
MAGERNYNPVQEQRKADKAKATKKGKCKSHRAQRHPAQRWGNPLTCPRI